MRIVLFTSRNKDNKNLINNFPELEFKSRSWSFLSNDTEEELMKKFHEFAEKGVMGEVSRFYISVNERNPEKVRKALMHLLIDHPDTDLTKMESKLASLAGKEGMKSTKHFLLDVDVKESSKLESVLDYLRENKFAYEWVYETPNGYGIITHGFDTRELVERFPFVEVHRDGKKFVAIYTKGA